MTDDGTMLACARIDEETPVTLAFTHSMYGGEVRDFLSEAVYDALMSRLTEVAATR